MNVGIKKSTFIKNSNQTGTGLRSGIKKAVDFTWEKAIPLVSDKLWEKSKDKNKKDLIKVVKGRGVGKDIAEVGVDMLYKQGLPWLAKKSVEMGRYYGLEALRNKKLQKK